jgi:hypothetical protein
VVAEQTHMLILPLEPGYAHIRPLPTTRVTASQVAESERAIWTSTVIGGVFDGTADPSQGFVELMTATISARGASGWLAWDRDGPGNEPMGGGGLFIYDGMGLFASDSTFPIFRGRGAQSELVYARLAESVRQGCDLAVVCTNPGSTSQRNYERLGFAVVYARTLMVREPKTD